MNKNEEDGTGNRRPLLGDAGVSPRLILAIPPFAALRRRDFFVFCAAMGRETFAILPKKKHCCILAKYLLI
jgi:hypothetical protein